MITSEGDTAPLRKRRAVICPQEAGGVFAGSKGSSGSPWVQCPRRSLLPALHPHRVNHVCTSIILVHQGRCPPTPVPLGHLGWQEAREPYNYKEENSLLISSHTDHTQNPRSFQPSKGGTLRSYVRNTATEPHLTLAQREDASPWGLATIGQTLS